MRAMVLSATGCLDQNPAPLKIADVIRPEPGHGEILIEVAVCGVCHTELDEIEGRTMPPRLPVIPGHEIVGRVAALGTASRRHKIGDRVGVGWIYSSTGEITENLSEDFRATGRDADGGYAEFVVVPGKYAYPIPDVFSDAEAAPLLCAGGVGYRSLKLTGLQNGQVLGLTGFGGSGHLVLHMAKHLYADCRVLCSRAVRRSAYLRCNWVLIGRAIRPIRRPRRLMRLSTRRRHGNLCWLRWSACDLVADW